MKESIRTGIYLAIAAVFVGGAVVVSKVTQPVSLEEYSKTGEPFFEDFSIESVARLELAAIPEGESKPQSFKLSRRDNIWRLQSYHGYPAEAQERLAKTAASALGIVRQAVAGKSESDHERFGVIDPLKKDIKTPKAAGKRIRMLDAKGEVLVDLIVGKKVSTEEQKPRGMEDDENALDQARPKHYVRRPDETETYIAEISLEVSTKFSEWIEPDLLKLDSQNVRTLKIDNYETEVVGQYSSPDGPVNVLEPTKRELVSIKRDSGFANWTISGLDEQKQELKTAKIDELLRVLDEMKILGVAPRYRVGNESPLTGDLKFLVPESIGDDGRARQRVLFKMLYDFGKRGYSFTINQAMFDKVGQSADPLQMSVISKQGDITIATHEGIVYHLHFGNEVVGSPKEIEIGGKSKSGPAKKKKKTSKGKASKSVPKKKAGDSDDTTRRYVMIRVEYDESYYLDKPKQPVKPTKPKRPVLPANKSRRAHGPVAAQRPGPRHDAAIAPRPDPLARFRVLNQEYKDAVAQYERDKSQYETDLKTFRDNVKKVKKRVQRLNERFAEWFYVISTQNMKQLSIRRAQIVGPKSKKLPMGRPKLPFGRFPGMR